MHPIVILVLFALFAASTAVKDMCMGITEPENLKCCNKYGKSKESQEIYDDLKECFQIPKKPPPNCEQDICIAKKRGYGMDDGTVNKAGFIADVERQFEKDPELQKMIKTECVEGDLGRFAPPDFCDVIKTRQCVLLQAALHCPDWSDEGHCKGMKDLVQKCKAQ